MAQQLTHCCDVKFLLRAGRVAIVRTVIFAKTGRCDQNCAIESDRRMDYGWRDVTRSVQVPTPRLETSGQAGRFLTVTSGSLAIGSGRL